MGLMFQNGTLARQYREFFEGKYYFVMSGTSQAAGVVTGTAALVLQRAPWLTPDEVKCVLMKAARPAVTDRGELAYSVFQQGAGLVHAGDAVRRARLADPGSLGCAHRGLEVSQDLAGLQHFGGRARQAQDGTYFLDGLEGYEWSGDPVSSEGYFWSDAFLWTDAYLWSEAFLWTDQLAWVDGFLWTDSYLWTDLLAEPAAINIWVDQE